MPDFIDKYIFNPNSLSIIEFLANYFISLLSTLMPFFIIIALVLGVFAWMNQGFDKSALIERFVQISLALSLTTLLLFTTGRKTVYLDQSTHTQSYLIIDTLNDFLVLGNRLADAFVYNMLFGFNYHGSDQPLFEFDSKNIFQLKNYDITPNGDDFVDGFFVSGLLNIVSKKIEQNFAVSQVLQTQIINKYHSDLATLKNVDNKIKNFIQDDNFVRTESFFKEKSYFDNLLEENVKNAIQKKQTNNIKLNLKNIDENQKLTAEDYFNVYNDTVKNIPFNYQHDFYNLSINLNDTDINDNKVTFKEFIYSSPFNYPTRYQIQTHDYSLDSDLLINKDILTKEINKILNTDNQMQGMTIFNNFMKENNLEIQFFDFNQEYQKLLNYDDLYSKMLVFFNKPQYINEYNLLTQKKYTFSEATDYINLYFSYLKYQKTILIGKMFNPNSGYQYKDIKNHTISDELFFNRMNFLISTLSDDFNNNNYSNEINDNGLSVGIKANIFFKTKLENSTNMTTTQINKVLLKANQQSLNYNSDIGAKFMKKNSNGFFQLKFLSNDFLLKNEINGLLFQNAQEWSNNNILPKEAKLNILINLDDYDKPNTVPFHWYNLSQYAVGLKNLMLQSSTFYSNLGVYDDKITSNTLITTCLPIYQAISDNKKSIKSIDDDIRGLCFPPTSNEKTFATKLGKMVAWVKGIEFGSKVAFKSVSFIGTPSMVVFSIAKSIVLGTMSGILIGYAYFVLIYTAITYLFFLIPTVFIFIAIVSWIIRASMALIFFGFSIILFLFTQKKDRLIENFYTFVMYVLMPLFISLILLLIIHLSFVMSITINNFIPDIGMNNYALGTNNNEIITHMVTAPNVQGQSWFTKLYEYIKETTTATTAVVLELKTNTGKLLMVGIYNSIIEFLKGILIIIIDLMLYTKLWKIDKFINEIISTSVKSAELSPEKMLHMFGTKGSFITSAIT